MNSKISQIAAAIAIFFMAKLAIAQNGPSSGPAGLPVTTMNLTVGEPSPASEWKDPNWKDPDIVLTNVSFTGGLPLTEVIHYIRDQFRGQFDILTPANWGDNPYSPPPIDPNTGQPAATAGYGTVDLSSISVTLELKNVTASELFNAMNMIFENDRTPLRWELKLNGKRQVALLHVLADPIPQLLNTVTPPPVVRRVYFIGDLIGDEKYGFMTMDQLIQTFQEVWKTTYNQPAALQFHRDAQLLVVSGTADQIAFAEDLLSALKQRVGMPPRGDLQQKDASGHPIVQQKTAAQKQADSSKTTDLKPAGK